MSTWSLVLCEGAHDQEFLCTLLVVAESWGVDDGFQVPGQASPRGPAFKTAVDPTGSRRLAVAALGGVTKLLGDLGCDLLRYNSATATAAAIIVDADGVGVPTRVAEARELWTRAGLPDSTAPQLGALVPGKPSSALWVAPDCSSPGSLDHLIVEAARLMNPRRVQLAQQFVTDLARVDSHGWDSFEDKARAGAIGQRWRAGGSLASALQVREAWMTPQIASQDPFRSLIDFLLRVAVGA